MPPNIGLKCSPIYPDFVYIKMASKMLIKIIPTTATLISILLCFFLPLFALAKTFPPLSDDIIYNRLYHNYKKKQTILI